MNKKECVFVVFENDVALCAIEKAWQAKKIEFQKPISCHLYPVRVSDYGGEFQAVNYHCWDICQGAVKEGEKERIPLYKVLKAPLIRRFGKSWYKELLAQVEQ